MKVAILAETPLWEEQHAHVYELAAKEIAHGNEVVLYQCRGRLKSCPANPNHSFLKCLLCNQVTRRTETLLEKIGVKFTTLEYPQFDPVKLSVNRFGPEASIKSAMSLEYKSLKIGRMVVSQLLGDLRDLPETLGDLERDFAERVEDGCALYDALVLEFRQSHVDKVFTWNGRRYSDGAFAQAGIDLGLEVEYFISGSTLDKTLVSSIPLHSSAMLESLSRELRAKFTSAEITSKGREWANVRRNGGSKIPGDEHFAKQFKGGFARPSNEKPLLVVFPSSAWEFLSTPLTDPEFIQVEIELIDQYGTLRRLLADKRVTDQYEVIVRWHPNLQSAGKNELTTVQGIIRDSPRVHHVQPHSTIDSYEIASQSSIVVVFGSSMGAEAAIMGRRVILVGPAAYEMLGFAEQPRNYEALLSLLGSPAPESNPQGAYIYGALQVEAGEALSRVELDSDRTSFNFLGHPLYPPFKLIRRAFPSKRFNV